MSSNVHYETSHLHGHITRNSHTKNRHVYAPRSSPRAFNVNSFGAKANGNDDSQVYPYYTDFYNNVIEYLQAT